MAISARTRTVDPGGRAAQGERTRRAILRTAVDLASAEGLEGLTIGRLAAELNMSKSGLFAHFGSKEGLQLATAEAAREIFIEEVVTPALKAPPGLIRLWRLCEIWLDYVRGEVFSGGCFFAAASAEFDGRPGQIRDRIAEIMREWLDGLESAVRDARERGQIESSVDAKQIAFELNALVMGANWAFQLYGDREAFNRASDAVLQRLRSVATSNSPALETSPSSNASILPAK